MFEFNSPDAVAIQPLNIATPLYLSEDGTYCPTGAIAAPDDPMCELCSFHLGECEMKKLARAIKHSDATFPSAVAAYFGLPYTVPSPATGWLVVALCLTSLLLDIAISFLSGPIAVEVVGGVILPSYLASLLRIHNLFPDLHTGKKSKLSIRQPSVLMNRGQTATALNLLGGIAKLDSEKIKLWLPVVNRPVAILPGINDKLLQEILTKSPFSLPVFLGRKNPLKGSTSVKIRSADFAEYDEQLLGTALRNADTIRALLADFSFWVHAKKKHQREIEQNIARFVPIARNGRFSKDLRSDPQVLIRAVSLSVLQIFLGFCSDNEWISAEDADRHLNDAWAHILPESAPTPPAEHCKVPAPSFWDGPELLWRVLTTYLKSGEVKFDNKGSPSTIALVNYIGDERYLILPRHEFCLAFRRSVFDIDDITKRQKFETWLPFQLRDEWGIQIKTESNDIGYRYLFYSKDAVPVNGTAKVFCLAIPWNQLPEPIRLLLQPNRPEQDSQHSEYKAGN